ncbi:unnamed protein product, partial [Ectocarpus sp. 12 AP-2014]
GDNSGLQSVDGTHSNAQTPPSFFSQQGSTLNRRVHVVERGAIDQVLPAGNRREGITKIASTRGCMLQVNHGLRASSWAASTSIWRRNHRLDGRT